MVTSFLNDPLFLQEKNIVHLRKTYFFFFSKLRLLTHAQPRRKISFHKCKSLQVNTLAECLWTLGNYAILKNAFYTKTRLSQDLIFDNWTVSENISCNTKHEKCLEKCKNIVFQKSAEDRANYLKKYSKGCYYTV